MTDMSSHPFIGHPLDMSGEGYYVLKRGAANSFRQTLKRQQRATTIRAVKTAFHNTVAHYPLLTIASSLALGAALVEAPHFIHPDHIALQPKQSAAPIVAKPRAAAQAAKPVVKVSYHSIIVTAQPTAKDEVNFLNSIDRIMSNKELMQDILNISAVNGSDPMDIMLTIAFETNGDASHFSHTVYHLNGKKVQHSARGAFQEMPDQFLALIHNDGFAYAHKLRVYAATLSDHNGQIFMMQRAEDLEKLSAYLRNKHYRNYKDLIIHDPIAKHMLNKTNFSFSGNMLIDMLLQDASNLKDVRELNNHTEAKFNLTLHQAQELIGKHIEEHLVNFLGPHMAAKITDLRAEGKGNLPMFPFIFPKKYMAEQNGAYCERTETRNVRVTHRVPVHVVAPNALHSTRHALPIVTRSNVERAHNKIAHKPTTHEKRAGAKLKHPPVHPTHPATARNVKPALFQGHHKKTTKPKIMIKHGNPKHKELVRGAAHKRATRVTQAVDKHKHPAARTLHPATAAARRVLPTLSHGHHEVAKPNTIVIGNNKRMTAKKPLVAQQFRIVTEIHIEKTCAAPMSIEHYYNRQMTRYENMFPDLNHKVQADIALDTNLAAQFQAAQQHRALLLAALSGNITLPAVIMPVRSHAQATRTANASSPANKGWYVAAQAVTANVYHYFVSTPGKPSSKPAPGFFSSFFHG